MNPAQQMIDTLSKMHGPERWLIVCFLVAAVIAQLLYYHTLQRTMLVLSPEHRPFPPMTVWLSLLPLVGLFWYMVYICMLSQGLRKTLQHRKLSGNGAVGITLALVAMIVLFLLPATQLYAALPALALWLLHWQRMARYRKLLADPVYMLVE